MQLPVTNYLLNHCLKKYDNWDKTKGYYIFNDNKDFNGIKLKGKISFTELLGDDSLVELKTGIDSMKVANTDSNFDSDRWKRCYAGDALWQDSFFQFRDWQ